MPQILIVEGHPSSREYLRSVLTDLGHQVTEAQDGEDGLERARQTSPALAFIDILMPTMDGCEFIKALRGQEGQAALPVIFWTAAYLKREALGLAAECGVNHILDKSALPNEISWVVEQCLGGEGLAETVGRGNEAMAEDLRIARDEAIQNRFDLHTATNRLSALSELVRSMASQGNVPSLLKELCDGARYLLGAKVAFAFTIDIKSGRMNLTHLSGTALRPQDEDIEEVCALWLENVNPRNRTARVGAGHEAMLRAFQACQPYSSKPYLGAVMLNPAGGMIGALVLGTKIGPLDFDDEEELLASAVAAHAGVACQNLAQATELQARFSELQSEIELRKIAESELHTAEADYRFSIQAAPYGVYRVGHDGKLLMVNRVLGEMLGYSEQESLDLQTEQIFFDRDEQQRLSERYTARGLLMSIESKWKKKSGEEIKVRLNGWPKFDQNGKLLWYEVAVENVTAQRQLDVQVQQAQRMEAVGQLAVGVAHDFNNLLMIISSYAELVSSDDFEKSAVLAKVARIQEAAGKAAVLTKQLLAFGRKQPQHTDVVDLNALLLELEGVLPRLVGENIQCTINCGPALGKVMVDRSEIEQVLLNLVLNARDAMPNGGTLTIETAHVDVDESYAEQPIHLLAGPYARITVGDTGIGIDEATRARIFEPFFTTKERGEGTGLGLSMVHGIVQQSGGCVWVDSAPGKGSAFEVYLPAIVETADTKSAQLQPENIPTGTETILLVEDEQALRTAVREFLRSTGYTVLEASNGIEAMQICGARKGGIDLLLTDYVMPGLSGLQLARMVATSQPDLRIICMSGYSDEATQVPKSSTAMTFLQKPFNLSTLAHTVRQVLTHNKSHSLSA